MGPAAATDRSRALLSEPRECRSVAEVLAARRDGASLLLRTSGTTSGHGRAVVRSTESWWSSFDAYSGHSGVHPDARLWVPGPLSATMNLFAATHAAVIGARLVDSPVEATHACLTPAAYRSVSAELPSDVVVTLGGMSTLGDYRHQIRPYYGAAELSFVAAGTPLRPFPGCQVEIRDGVIWVRSPYLATGYQGAPEGPFRIAAGWATVGDLGQWGTDGELLVLGRPDAINSAGVTVTLAEVEAALADIAPVVCFGVDHARLGHILALATTSGDALDSLRRAALERLAPGHRPHAWHVVSQFPLTRAGKVDRDLLSRMVSGGDLPRR